MREETNKEKKLYKGIFNYKGYVHKKYVHAYSEDQAFRLICRKIADDLNLTNDIDIRHYFWGTVYYEITLERKEKSYEKIKDTEESSIKEGT